MFTLNDLRALLQAKPFAAFRLHLSDGGQVDVLSHEAVLLTRRHALIGLMESNETVADRWTIVAYMHITRAELLKSGAPPLSPPPGPSETPHPAPV